MSKRQPRSWGPGEQAEQHYLVEPRHLAGAGDLRHVTEYLRAAGWKDRSKADRLVFAAPDRSVVVGFDPHTPPGGWTISGRETATQPAWHATLTPRVPVEIVAGLTDALTQPRPAHAPDVWAPLQQQSWSRHQGQHVTAVSPDKNTWVQFHQNSPGDAHWWAGARTEHGRLWGAVFTSTTPMHLVQTFSTALSDPQPVMRPRGHVPQTNRIRTTSVSVRPSELRAWEQARIHAARAAAWARNSLGKRPRTAPATPSVGQYAGQKGRVR
ncbi:DUF317 domain-containing protein [Streptomyces noursei]